MEKSYLPYIASIPEACEWLLEQTGKRWTLAGLLEHGLVPWFWLDYQTGWPDVESIFNGRTEGFLAPLCFAGDTRRLADGGDDVLVTMTRTVEGMLIRFTPPYVPTFPIKKLRFKSDEIKRLAEKCNSVSADVSDGTTKSLSGDDWKVKAKEAAQRIGLVKWEAGIRQITARNICEEVADELSKDEDTHGMQGQRSPNNVRTEGLRGWKFCPPEEVKKVD